MRRLAVPDNALATHQAGEPSEATILEHRASRSEYWFRSELTAALTIVVVADSADKAREELARIGLHPAFFELLGGE